MTLALALQSDELNSKMNNFTTEKNRYVCAGMWGGAGPVETIWKGQERHPGKTKT